MIRKHLICPLITFATMLVASSCQGQAVDSPANDVAANWKSSQLAELDQQLSLGPESSIPREELTARKAWLDSWRAGKMSAVPNAGSQLPPVRSEPILTSTIAAKLRESSILESEDQDDSILLMLNESVAQYPGDIGLQQLQLHWLDLPVRRKTFLAEVDAAALQLLESLRGQEGNSPEIRLAIEFTLYRRARALAYRELPVVVKKTPIENPDLLNQQILNAYKELMEVSGKGHPEFILLEIRMLRRAKSYGRALGLLEKYGLVIRRQWYLKKRRDLLKELDWELPFAEAEKIYAAEFPEEVAKEQSQE